MALFEYARFAISANRGVELPDDMFYGPVLGGEKGIRAEFLQIFRLMQHFVGRLAHAAKPQASTLLPSPSPPRLFREQFGTGDIEEVDALRHEQQMALLRMALRNVVQLFANVVHCAEVDRPSMRTIFICEHSVSPARTR